MKKILVTGGCGFIASFLIKKLLKNKNNFILNLDALKKQSVPESLNEIKKNKNYKFLKVDITNYKKTNKIISQFKPNLIFHLAAESHVDRSILNPSAFIFSNINATTHPERDMSLSSCPLVKPLRDSLTCMASSIIELRSSALTWSISRKCFKGLPLVIELFVLTYEKPL